MNDCKHTRASCLLEVPVSDPRSWFVSCPDCHRFTRVTDQVVFNHDTGAEILRNVLP